MKGGLKQYGTLSSTGTLHNAANGDAGRDASLPFALDQAGDLSGYDVCGHVGCFEKEYNRRNGIVPGLEEELPETPTPSDGSSPVTGNPAEVPSGELTPDSVGEAQAPAKKKGGAVGK